MKHIILFAALLLPTLAFANIEHSDTLIVCAKNGFTAEAVNGSTIIGSNGKYTVKCKGWLSGVEFSGKWDFSSYSTIRFTVENRDKIHPLYICCDMYDSHSKKTKFTRRTNVAEYGAFEGVTDVSPQSTKTVEFRIPPIMPYRKEVNERFRLMRCTPYSLALGLFSYDIDMTDVRHLSIASVCGGAEYVISDISFIPGPREIPAILKINGEDFFPFVDKYGQYKHSDWSGKTHSDIDLATDKEAEEKDLAAHKGPMNWNKWGGWSNGPHFEATGQFRVQKVDNYWWIIDPDGCLFWSHGVVRVTTSSCVTPLDKRYHYFESLPQDSTDPFYAFYYTHDDLLHPYYLARGIQATYDYSSANAFRKYGENYKQEFAEMAHRRCRSWGINTMANSSDPAICAMDKTVYNERVDLGAPMDGFPKWPVLEKSEGWWPFIDPFDALFPTCVRAHLEAKKTQLEDPWCMGFYVDNEIKWGDQTNFARLALTASESQASKKILVNVLKKKYKKIQVLNDEWDSDFDSWKDLLANREALPSKADKDLKELTPLIVDKYFAVVRKVFKEIAPDKLYMGCRFSSSPEFVVRIAANYVDVMSYNTYTYDRSEFSLPKGIDLPVILGEFHFGAMDRGMFHPGQVTTSSQKGKAEAYEYYVKSCLENRFIVGTNWHQFSDQPCSGRFDGENFQVGFTDCCDKPYPEMVEALRDISSKMYQIRYESAK